MAGNTLEISWIQKPDDLVLLRMVVEESRVPLITAGRLPFGRHGSSPRDVNRASDSVYSWQILGLSKLLASLLAAVLLAALGACRTAGVQRGPQLIQPGAPGEPSRVITADQAADLSQVRHTPGDVAFMQGMIGHHAQALEMTALLATRSTSDDMRKLGLRIEVSQADEIRMMQEWLRRRGQEVPGEHAHHAHGARLMPGMLTAEEMERLAAGKGVEFDRLFLEFMIRHHTGALVMVEELFKTPGAGQEGEMFAFASDVDADQRMEIARMTAMLKELQK